MTGARTQLTKVRIAACAIGLAVLILSQATAQTVNVTLSANDGDMAVSGKLLEATPTAYVVATPIGALSFAPDTVTCTSRACPVPRGSVAQDIPEQMRRITLSSLDGQIKIEGRLEGVSQDAFYVEVQGLGQIRVSQTGLRCSGPGCLVTEAVFAPIRDTVRIAASADLLQGALSKLITRFAEQSGLDIASTVATATGYDVSLSGNGGVISISRLDEAEAFTALAAQTVDLVITHRASAKEPMGVDVAADPSSPQPDIEETLLAVTGFSIFTHEDLALPDLSLDQIRGIYRRDITNWADVGGPDGEIIPVTYEPGSSKRQVFDDALFRATGPDYVSGVITASSSEIMTGVLDAFPFSIGYDWNAYAADLKPVRLVGSCGLVNEATPFRYKAGDALLSGRLFMYESGAQTTGLAGAIADYMGTTDAQNVLTVFGFISPQVARAPLTDLLRKSTQIVLKPGLQTEMALRLINDASGWDRLSATFRPDETAPDRFDVASSNTVALLNYLSVLPADSEIVFAGFGDDQGTFESSVQRSNEDADRVAEAMRAAHPEVMANRVVQTRGFGSLAPILCGAKTKASVFNRRVEVWVRSDRR